MLEQRLCPACRGLGFIEYVETNRKVRCNLCIGSGFISEETYNRLVLGKKNSTCLVCGGSGVINIAGSATPCPKCNPIADEQQSKKHFPPPLGHPWWNNR